MIRWVKEALPDDENRRKCIELLTSKRLTGKEITLLQKVLGPPIVALGKKGPPIYTNADIYPEEAEEEKDSMKKKKKATPPPPPQVNIKPNTKITKATNPPAALSHAEPFNDCASVQYTSSLSYIEGIRVQYKSFEESYKKLYGPSPNLISMDTITKEYVKKRAEKRAKERTGAEFQSALVLYTYTLEKVGLYSIINEGLSKRNNQKFVTENYGIILHMLAALRTFPRLECGLPLYRTVGGDIIDVRKCKVGTEMFWDRFTSTSMHKE